METKLQAVIFDLDGVITDTAEYHFLAWKELATQLGIDIDRDFNEQLKGISRTESLERILAYGEKADQYNEQEKTDLATQKNEHYVQLIKNITPTDILPGIKELLQTLKTKNIKIGLASASKNASAILERLQLTHYFDAIADAGEIKNGKPDPEIFLTAAKLLNVDPDHCLGVEDAQAGVESIKRAGMFAVGVGSEDVLNEADYIVANTSLLSYSNISEKFEQQN